MNSNSQKSYTQKTARGKDVDDPSIAVRYKGKTYVVDGQHRLNQALKDGRPAKVVVMDGDFMPDKVAAYVTSGRTHSGI